MPYTIVLYPIIFFFLGRMWSVAHRHGYVTTADIVQGRYGTRSLSLAVALTGILATMPYIALQLVGIQAVLEVVGLGGESVLAQDLPLLIAFAVLAAYTYSSGLRAPAMIAFVKDSLIYLVIAVAVIYLPLKLGGWAGIFDAAEAKMAAPSAANPAMPTGAFIPAAAQHWAYASLALGSALALFMYPHCVTATLSSKDRSTGRRNAAILPAYSLLLGLLALLGFVAIKAGTQPIGLDGKPNPQLVIPQLFEDNFPDWFTGVAFGAIAIGALVPAAIMSIAAANLFTRNIYKAYLKPEADRRPGGQGLQDRLADHQARRPAVRAHPGPAGRAELPAARRGVDPADAAVDRVRPVHPLVPSLGAADRLGGRHDLRHGRRLRVLHRLQHAAVRQLAGRGAGAGDGPDTSG